MPKKVFITTFSLGLIFGLFFSAKVLALDYNVTGYAWSDNIGWISFNCDNEKSCATSSYGVDIDAGGDFSGYAWSEYIGWISFNSTACGAPVEVNLVSGKVTGWAKVLNPGEGLSGCINMSGANYGVTVNPSGGDFTGYAWSEDFGWINFNGSTYKVKFNFGSAGPVIISLKAEYENPCLQSRVPNISWETSVAKPYDYVLLFYTTTGTFLYMTADFNTYDTSWAAPCTYFCQDYDLIEFGENTYVIELQAGKMGPAGPWEIKSINFTTPKNAYPFVNFKCNGKSCTDFEINENEEVVLSNTSTIYAGTPSCHWTLPPDVTEIIEGEVTDCEIKVKFLAAASNKSITLKVTDGSGYQCSEKKNINVRYPLPEYRETSPLSLLKNIMVKTFKKVVNVFARI